MLGKVRQRSVTIQVRDTVLAGDLWQPLEGNEWPGVVLLHGFGSDRREMARSAVELAQRGIVALTFDLRGHGQSGGVYGEDPVDDVLAALAALARQPGVDAKRLALVGHSMGGRLVLLAAAREPIVAATVALAPADDADGRRLFARVKDLPGGPFLYPDDNGSFPGVKPRQFAQIMADMRRLGYRLTVDWVRMARAWAATPLADVVASIAPRPVLLVHCLWDNKVSLRHTLRLYCRAKSGRRLLLLPWGVHSSTYRSTMIRRLWVHWLVHVLRSPVRGATPIVVPIPIRYRDSKGGKAICGTHGLS